MYPEISLTCCSKTGAVYAAQKVSLMKCVPCWPAIQSQSQSMADSKQFAFAFVAGVINTRLVQHEDVNALQIQTVYNSTCNILHIIQSVGLPLTGLK